MSVARKIANSPCLGLLQLFSEYNLFWSPKEEMSTEQQDKRFIEDYLRLLQTGDLSFDEICPLIQVDSNYLKSLLCNPKYKSFVTETAQAFQMTYKDIWNRVDHYLRQGVFSDEEIAYFLNVPFNQVCLRKRFLAKRLI